MAFQIYHSFYPKLRFHFQFACNYIYTHTRVRLFISFFFSSSLNLLKYVYITFAVDNANTELNDFFFLLRVLRSKTKNYLNCDSIFLLSFFFFNTLFSNEIRFICVCWFERAKALSFLREKNCFSWLARKEKKKKDYEPL